MPQIVFVTHEGARTVVVDAPDGQSLMRIAQENGIGGIVAVCGGACCCGTCHVYVLQQWADRLPSPSEDERAMLEFVAAERLPESRLACQIFITEACDGLTVIIPAIQTTGL